MPASATFPQVARRVIEAARPELKVEVRIETVMHPTDLPAAVSRTMIDPPDIAVVEIIGWVAVRGRRSADLTRLPPRLQSAYARAAHLQQMASAVAAEWGAGPIVTVKADAVALAASPLRRLVRRLPRPDLPEYEHLVRDSLARLGGTTVVIQGPGDFNRDLAMRGVTDDALRIYREVDAMARRIAAEHCALFVDRFASVARGFYQPGSIRPGVDGHALWGHMLADELLAAGLV